jgi:membrane protein DedA with SNARE-associated domain
MSHEAQKAVLDRIDGYASWLLGLVSLGMLASLALGENNPVTDALNILLVFVSGIVLGIVWIRLTLRRMGAREEP